MAVTVTPISFHALFGLVGADFGVVDMNIDGREVHFYSIAMTQKFRGITVREGALIRSDAGWGEFSPFAEYDSDESRAWWNAACDAADNGFPTPVRSSIPVNVTIPAIDPDTATRLVHDSGGCTTAKVKVAEAGQSLNEDIARVEAVRAALGQAGKIRIDVNGRWDVDTAIQSISVLDRVAGGLEYVEQPCADVESLAHVRRRVNVPIAADESIRRSDDPMRVASAQAADIVVLKVQPLGGVRKALELADRLNLPVVVSSAVETSVGLAMGVALAAALPELPYACGLGTIHLLEDDVTTEPLVPVKGEIPVRAVHVDEECLKRVEPSQECSNRWDRRIRDVLAGKDGE